MALAAALRRLFAAGYLAPSRPPCIPGLRRRQNGADRPLKRKGCAPWASPRRERTLGRQIWAFLSLLGMNARTGLAWPYPGARAREPDRATPARPAGTRRLRPQNCSR